MSNAVHSGEPQVLQLLRRLAQAIGHEDWQAAGQLDLQLRGALAGCSADTLSVVQARYAELMQSAAERRRVLAQRISEVRRRHSRANSYARVAGDMDGASA